MNQELLNQAQLQLKEAELLIFIDKLASYGVHLQTEAQLQAAVNRADELLANLPNDPSLFANIKSASVDFLGREMKFAQDGYSVDAHAYTDLLVQDPATVKATQILLAAQTV